MGKEKCFKPVVSFNWRSKLIVIQSITLSWSGCVWRLRHQQTLTDLILCIAFGNLHLLTSRHFQYFLVFSEQFIHAWSVSRFLLVFKSPLEFAIADFCSFWVTLADGSLKGVAYTHISYFEILEVFSEDTPRAKRTLAWRKMWGWHAEKYANKIRDSSIKQRSILSPFLQFLHHSWDSASFWTPFKTSTCTGIEWIGLDTHAQH